MPEVIMHKNDTVEILYEDGESEFMPLADYNDLVESMSYGDQVDLDDDSMQELDFE